MTPTQSIVVKQCKGFLLIGFHALDTQSLDSPSFHQSKEWFRVPILLNTAYGISHKGMLCLKPSHNHSLPSIASHSIAHSHPSPNTLQRNPHTQQSIFRLKEKEDPPYISNPLLYSNNQQFCKKSPPQPIPSLLCQGTTHHS